MLLQPLSPAPAETALRDIAVELVRDPEAVVKVLAEIQEARDAANDAILEANARAEVDATRKAEMDKRERDIEAGETVLAGDKERHQNEVDLFSAEQARKRASLNADIEAFATRKREREAELQQREDAVTAREDAVAERERLVEKREKDAADLERRANQVMADGEAALEAADAKEARLREALNPA